MSVIGIVAIAKNFAIGRGGKLPWHYSADLKFFKETTTGHTVVMGANTWNSIGKPLPNRKNVVLSRSGKVESPPDVFVLKSKDEVFELAGKTDDIFIIGGASVYKTFADEIDKWIVTDIPIDVEDADTFMPKDFLNDFKVIETNGLGDGLLARVLRRK